MRADVLREVLDDAAGPVDALVGLIREHDRGVVARNRNDVVGRQCASADRDDSGRRFHLSSHGDFLSPVHH